MTDKPITGFQLEVKEKEGKEKEGKRRGINHDFFTT